MSQISKKWISPNDELPSQGKKILWLCDGDVQLAQRYNKFWLPMPFISHRHCNIHPPDLWQDIQLPEPMTGKIFIQVKGYNRMIDVDELEFMEPEVYKDMINMFLESVPKKVIAQYKHRMGISAKESILL